jgi:hypothetical protein
MRWLSRVEEYKIRAAKLPFRGTASWDVGRASKLIHHKAKRQMAWSLFLIQRSNRPRCFETKSSNLSGEFFAYLFR